MTPHSAMNTENPREGYIKLFRSILRHPLFEDHPPEYLKIWIFLLCKAARKPYVWWDGTTEVKIPIGGVVSSLNKIAAACRVSRRQVERALHVFAKCEMVVTVTGSKKGHQPGHNGSLHVITNYTGYQSYNGETGTPTGTPGGHQPGRQGDASVTPGGRQGDTSTIGEREKGKVDVVVAASPLVSQQLAVKESLTRQPDPVRDGHVWPPMTNQPEPTRTNPNCLALEPDGYDRQALAYELVVDLLTRHPGGGGRDQAILALSEIIANPDPRTEQERQWTADPVGTCEMIRSAHARWLVHIAKGRGNGFQPKMALAKWIRDRDWLRHPEIETTDEKVARAIQDKLAEIRAQKAARNDARP